MQIDNLPGMKRKQNPRFSRQNQGRAQREQPLNDEVAGRRFSPLPGGWLFGLFLVLVTLLAYQPVWHAGFIWDDEHYVTENALLHSVDGLRLIWFVPGATVQYYPLTFTTFWLEYHLWGLHPLGFHLVNVILHSFNAILFWVVLRKLRVPGAWLAAGIFALHPVCVDSVAWVTERKNTLSGLFYLASLLAALKFWLPGESSPQSVPAAAIPQAANSRVRPFYWWLALLFYVAALLSKTAAAPLPAVILLIIWWQQGRITRRDLAGVLPFFAVGIALGLITVFVERHIGAAGREWDLSWLARGQVAGKDFWFYLAKVCWPYPLIFVYPHWETNASQVFAYLPIMALAAGALLLWWQRKDWGRPFFVALLYYLALLALVLGFINVFYFRYSFVSDHFQYLALLGPLALIGAGLSRAFRFLGIGWRLPEPVLAGILWLILGALTWRHCGNYTSLETVWRATLAENPKCWLADSNLGHLLLSEGHADEALTLFNQALAVNPNDAMLQNNAGSALMRLGQSKAAFPHFEKALELQPNYALAYNNLGDYFLKSGQPAAAIRCLRKALVIEPTLTEAGYNLGDAFAQAGELDLAIQQWRKLLILQPDHVQTLNNLGNALLHQGRVAEAIACLKQAVENRPDYVDALNNLGSALIQSGRLNEAIEFLRKALEVRPDFVPAENNLAWVLATCPTAALRNGAEALQLAERASRLTGENNPVILRTLAAAYAENGQFSQALATARQGLQLLASDNDLADNLRMQIRLYEAGQPFRDALQTNAETQSR